METILTQSLETVGVKLLESGRVYAKNTENALKSTFMSKKYLNINILTCFIPNIVEPILSNHM